MSETLIKVENVSKKFCRDLKQSLFYGLTDLGNELIGRSAPGKNGLRKKEFWAVDNVSFEVKRGECLGLIGRNGAGKSTLLKMLNGLIKPDAGRIEMKGRIGALIELGAGFNPILTGRENIYINGAVLGMPKKEVDGLFDQIVAFSELEDFIDTPVQYYSSGMKVRLGFAIASQLKPDILLIDEVLAVGDVGFKLKCFNEIYKLIENAAVIFVSHSMPQVGKVCTRGMVLKDGTCRLLSNNLPEVIQQYYNLFEFQEVTQLGNKKAKVISFSLKNGKSEVVVGTNHFDEKYFRKENIEIDISAGVEFKLKIEVEPGIEKFKILYSISDFDQKIVAQVSGPDFKIMNNQREVTVFTKIPETLLNNGKYSLGFLVINAKGDSAFSEFLIGFRDLISLSVKRSNYFGAAPIIYNADWFTE